jgi:hypothetical protein
MCGFGEDDVTRTEMESKCQVLMRELQEVVIEATLPKVSDACEDDQLTRAKITQDIAGGEQSPDSFNFV